MRENLERILWSKHKVKISYTLNMISEGQVKVNGILVPNYKKALKFDTRQPNTVVVGKKKYKIPIRT